MSADTITIRLTRETVDPITLLDPDTKIVRVVATVLDEQTRLPLEVIAYDIRLDRRTEEHLREKEVPRDDGTMGHPDYEEWFSYELSRAMAEITTPLAAQLTPRDPGRPQKIWEQYGENYKGAIDDLIGGGGS